jgi:hypothetical protein
MENVKEQQRGLEYRGESNMNVNLAIPLQNNSSIKPEYKQFSRRDNKGYNGELLVKYKLDYLGYLYQSNPLENILVWKQYQAKGPDFRVNGNIELEVKNTDSIIYSSWIVRDWTPRFSYHNETRVVTCPNDIKLSVKVLEGLFNRNINICYFDSLEYLAPNKANKLLEVNGVEPYTLCNRSSNNYRLKPKKSQKHSLNIARTETLNQFLTDKKNSKTENKEGHSGRGLSCFNCIKNVRCPILQKLRELEVKRPCIREVQFNITDNLKDRKKIDREDFKKRNREWLIRYDKVWIEQLKCLNRRIYLQLKMNYKLFNIEPGSTNHKV